MRWNCLPCCRGVQLLPGGNFADYTYNILTTASSVTIATQIEREDCSGYAFVVNFFRESREQDQQENLRWRHLLTFFFISIRLFRGGSIIGRIEL